MEEKEFTREQQLDLINKMINKAKNSYHDTGIGPILWGSVISVCSLLTWYEVNWRVKLPFDIWLLTLLAIIPQVVISIKEKRSRKARSYDSTAMDFIWISFGVAIFLLVHINISVGKEVGRMLRTFREMGIEESFRYSSYSLSQFMLLYGIPTIITAGIMRFRPMLIGGIVCWVCCIISVYTPVSTDLLLTALSAVSAWLIPGIILWRRYRKQQSAHV